MKITLLTLFILEFASGGLVFEDTSGHQQGGEGAEFTACSPLQPRPSAGRLAPYAVLSFAAQAGFKMEEFRCKIPPSYSQNRGQNSILKFRLPFLPGSPVGVKIY
jgi:hypothetical protein